MVDSDLFLLGLSDAYACPEWMILTVFPVRPSIAVDGSAMRSEDDLTYKLGDIIKASLNVRRCETEGAPVSSNYCRYGLVASTSREAPLTLFLYSSMMRHI
jgi:DNA-directed RNA polymerase beta' subunit